MISEEEYFLTYFNQGKSFLNQENKFTHFLAFIIC